MRRWSSIATLLTLALLVAYLAHEWPHVRRLEIVSYSALLICMLGHAGSLAAAAGVNFVMLRQFKSTISYPTCYFLGVATAVANLLLPMRGGLAARAVYLKKVHSVSYAHFAVSILGYYMLVFTLCSFLAVGACLLKLAATEVWEAELLMITWASLAALAVNLLLVFLPPLPHFTNPLLQKIARVSHGWHELRSKREALFQLMGLTLFEIGNSLLVLGGAYAAVGKGLALVDLVLVASLSNIAFFIGLTPGGLGVYETVIAYTAKTSGMSPAVSVSVTLLSRLVLLLLLLVLGPLSSKQLSMRIKEEAA